MDGTKRLAAVMAATIIGALATAAPSFGAQFTAQPPVYVQPSAEPFEFTFAVDDPTALLAYRMDAGTWLRCTAGSGTLSISGLAEGSYTLSIADDPAPCDPSSGDPVTPVTERLLVVDGTAPAITRPLIQRISADRGDIRVLTSVTDLTSGIAEISWLPGDGSPAVTGTPTLIHHYGLGRWTGSVTAVDRAGNRTTRSFTVAVSAPPPPRPVLGTVRPRPAPRVPDKLAPTLDLLRVGSRVLARDGLLVRAAVSERGVVSATGTVRIAGRSYPLVRAGKRLATPATVDLRLTASKRVRGLIRRALARQVAVRASLQVKAKDPLNNARVVQRTIRLRG